MNVIGSDEEILGLLRSGAHFLDVRSETEGEEQGFSKIHTHPILTDSERAEVGKTYKQKGGEAAVELGHSLVSGTVKEERVAAWIDAIQEHELQALFCWRGGMRSEIAQSWLFERGISLPKVEGGYKRIRNLLLSYLEDQVYNFRPVQLGGFTGSGKTSLLHQVEEEIPFVDLEGLANHRGSAFGGLFGEQPSQARFENDLIISLLRLSGARFLVEEESRMIGRCAVPEPFFSRLRESPVIEIEVPRSDRAKTIFQEYIQFFFSRAIEDGADPEAAKGELCEFLQSGLYQIKKRLGGVRFEEAKKLLQEATSLYPQDISAFISWISFLLQHYYDPFYEYARERRRGETIRIKPGAFRETAFTLLQKAPETEQ